MYLEFPTIYFALLIPIFPLFCLILLVATTRFFLQLLTNFCGGYGRLLRPMDGAPDGILLGSNPQSSLVSTFELNGNITIQEIRHLFEERVLCATVRNSKSKKLRYPEFRQYISTFCGFLIWKNDDDFDLDNHILEIKAKTKFIDMGELHQSLLNHQLNMKKSPWQLTLLRDVIPLDESPGESATKTILAFQIHHMMSDAKSVMKIIVECLGNKSLRIPAAHYQNMNVLRRFLLPLDIFREYGKVIVSSWKHQSHPWKVEPNDSSKNIVKFTKPMSVNDMKSLAANHGVTLSAVLMTLIAGAMRRLNPALTERGVILGYALPKENHPSILANHVRFCLDLFPTNGESQSSSVSDRLFCYASFFKSISMPKRCMPFEIVSSMIGSLPRCRFKNEVCTNFGCPIMITNIAGEQEGFSVGEAWCSGFRMSVSSPRGVTGALFCALSYQNSLRIAVTGKESVVPERDAEKLVNLIGLEYDDLVGPKTQIITSNFCNGIKSK